MSNRIQTPTIGEILTEEFLQPMGLSVSDLALELHLPVSEIQDLLDGRCKITSEISLRLAKFFSLSKDYFLNLQNDIAGRENPLKEGLN